MAEVQERTDGLTSSVDRRNGAGQNVAHLLRNLHGAYETGDDALIEQAEDALNAVMVDKVEIPVQD